EVGIQIGEAEGLRGLYLGWWPALDRLSEGGNIGGEPAQRGCGTCSGASSGNGAIRDLVPDFFIRYRA
ncbi:hypothetical protein NL676_008734, partial [Syzygium grande]